MACPAAHEAGHQDFRDVLAFVWRGAHDATAMPHYRQIRAKSNKPIKQNNFQLHKSDLNSLEIGSM